MKVHKNKTFNSNSRRQFLGFSWNDTAELSRAWRWPQNAPLSLVGYKMAGFRFSAHNKG